MLMSSDVSGIPSFPPSPLCVASLREHTHCRIRVRQNRTKSESRRDRVSEKWGGGLVGKGAEEGRRQGHKDREVFLQEPGLCISYLCVPSPRAQ